MNNNSSSGSAGGDHQKVNGPLRLSFRNPHTGSKESISFKNGNLMSPRTTTIQSHPSSSSHVYKEVPRAVLNHSDEIHQLSSDDSFKIADEKSLVEDSIQGLEALAASAVASLPHENRSFMSADHQQIRAQSIASIKASNSLSEDSKLGKLFMTPFDGDILKFYQEHCATESINQAHALLADIIKRVDDFLQSKSLNLPISHIVHLFITRLISQESSRTRKQDFTLLLLDKNFLSSSTAILLSLPHLISVMFKIDEIAETVGANLFDILLSIEPIFRALPELLSLSNAQHRIKLIQQYLLEEAIWKDTNSTKGKGSNLYSLLAAEIKFHKESQILNGRVVSTLNGIRSPQKALETLAGFRSGSRICRLELFFRKYLRLGFQRIQLVTKQLGLSKGVCQMSWEFFVELVQREGMIEDDNTPVELFKGRHLNQILLAVIFTSTKLLDQERTFQQISQCLSICNLNLSNSNNPSLTSTTSNSNWISHVYTKSGETCDFYTFYNEIFVPPLQKRIERLLSAHTATATATKVDDRWILERLFTSAPVPCEPVHQLASNVFVNILDKLDFSGKISNNNTTCNNNLKTSMYEFTSPYISSSELKTPSQTVQLFNRRRHFNDDNILSSSIEDDGEADYEEEEEEEQINISNSKKRKQLLVPVGTEHDDRIRKISKRLDFN